MSDEHVTVAAYIRTVDAELARVRLELNGVECQLDRKNAANMNMLYSTAIGGIDLKVNAADLDRARKILEILDSDSAGEAIPDMPSFCPNCDSEQIQELETGRATGMFRGPRKFRCKDCGHKWEKVGW